MALLLLQPRRQGDWATDPSPRSARRFRSPWWSVITVNQKRAPAAVFVLQSAVPVASAIALSCGSLVTESGGYWVGCAAYVVFMFASDSNQLSK